MHKLLDRQLKKCFGDDAVVDARLSHLILLVDAAYNEHDKDRALLERTIELASSELVERNARLERDLEAIKRLELELRQAEKLRAVGQLASGIAHEINTPIQFVGDSVHFLKGALSDLLKLGEVGRRLLDAVERGEGASAAASELRESAAEIDLEYLLTELPRAFEQTTEGVRRVANIVAAMKDFGRADHGERVPTDINRCLDSTLTVAHNEVKYVADVQVSLGAVPLVPAHAGEISQVFLNLLVNAAHAIGDRVKGTEQRGLLRVSSYQEADEVVVAIADSGTGIAEENRARIFEPFFTTKPIGKGTGQGLAIARSIIQKHGGSLTFESTVGEGTTFFVRLPLEVPASRSAPPCGLDPVEP